ncbi:MAG: hypothetical protein JXB39_04995 [Deltaproteobacteria bacterium]|nr:hypothetical protein [Deltaproteobacteria bacterium]
MFRRMLFVTLLLGVPSAFADGLGVSPGMGVSSHAHASMAGSVSHHAVLAGSVKPLFKALLFGRNARYDRPREEGEITF